ncbi:MAG TPA: MerR family transcriptional regulator [Deltaproteobacteria bacterium]|nr:MerR family transcriptional regulator [Deltaproteobacteria bacterium]
MNFNTKTTGRIVGLTKRQLDYWDKTHFIKPSVREAEGYGSTRLYSFTDLVQLKVAKTLLDRGISLQKMRKSLIYLKKNMPEIDTPLADLKFLTDGETVFVITRKNAEIIDTLRNGQLIFTVALGELIKELKGEVKNLHDKKTYTVRVRKKEYAVVLHADTEDGGYWIECPAIPGCASQGDTIEEALNMIKDAIDGCTQVLPLKRSGAQAT